MRSIRKNNDMEFDISYTNKEITPWGGMIFLKQMLQKMGFRSFIESNSDLPKPESNRGYKTSIIIESFITSIWCGANRCMHTEVTRHDMALGKILIGKKYLHKTLTKGFFQNSLKR